MKRTVTQMREKEKNPRKSAKQDSQPPGKRLQTVDAEDDAKHWK